MSTNQFNWAAPSPPVFGGSQASFGYSIHGVNITVMGSGNGFVDYPAGLFGESRYGIGGMYFDVTPNEVRNITLAQPDLLTLYVSVGFEFKDTDLVLNNFTYEWRHPNGQYQPALMVAPLLPSAVGTASFVPYTAYWDISNEPEFLHIYADQDIQFRVTANNGSIWRAIESPVTTLIIDIAPVITSMPPDIAYVREHFVYSPVASDPQNDIYNWTLVGAPIGMSFSSATGRMEWQPLNSAIDHLDFILKVFDEHGASATQTFRINVMLRNPNLREHVSFPTTKNKEGNYQIDLYPDKK